MQGVEGPKTWTQASLPTLMSLQVKALQRALSPQIEKIRVLALGVGMRPMDTSL